jgi:hypothetical protein
MAIDILLSLYGLIDDSRYSTCEAFYRHCHKKPLNLGRKPDLASASNIFFVLVIMFNDYLGPLSSEYCVYFYVLTILALIALVFALVGGVYQFTQKKIDLLPMVMSVISAALLYIQNRLLYSMCVSALKKGGH